MKPPKPATLRKYGMSEEEWQEMWHDQGEICPICGRSEALMVVDHEHVRGWKKMPPEQRKLYARGIICSWCNMRIVGRGATAKKLINGAHYLLRYEMRKPK